MLLTILVTIITADIINIITANNINDNIYGFQTIMLLLISFWFFSELVSFLLFLSQKFY